MLTKVVTGLYVSRRFYSKVVPKIKAQKYVLTKYFQGEPKKSDFKIVEEEISDLNDGEILTQAEYLSVDPYMRAYMIGYKLPTDMIGGQVAKIIASRNALFPVGKYVCGSFGWRTHTICDPRNKSTGLLPLILLPDLSPYPISLALGVLGMPGLKSTFKYGYPTFFITVWISILSINPVFDLTTSLIGNGKTSSTSEVSLIE